MMRPAGRAGFVCAAMLSGFKDLEQTPRKWNWGTSPFEREVPTRFQAGGNTCLKTGRGRTGVSQFSRGNMSEMTEVPALELAALMCSRVCHDVISPVGAIVNGLEVLAEEEDEEMRGHAMKLIADSAAQASAKLQFARLAFGAAGSAGAEIDLADARAVVDAMTNGERVKILWDAPAANMGKDYVKLLLNMVLIGMAAVPRGGDVNVKVEGDTVSPTIHVRSTGKAARIPDETLRFLHGPAADRFLDARAAQPYFTGAVARSLGLDIEARMEGEDFVIEAKPGA